MAISLSNLANKLAKGIQKIKCKYGHDDKIWETCGIKYKDCECCLEYVKVKDDLIECKVLCCNKKYQKNCDENLEKQFVNKYKFFNHHINNFFLFLRKSHYPCEYIDNWKKYFIKS